jgi:hypothetical protein
MSEFEQDPSANTGRFRAFYEAQEPDKSKSTSTGIPRGVLIGGIVLLAVIVIAVVIGIAG